MIESLKREVKAHGDECRVIPAGRLDDLRRDIEKFKKNGHLNGFQKYIVDEMYQFGLPDVGFEVRSIVVVASSVPSHAKVILNWQGRKVHTVCPARSRDGRVQAAAATRQYLTAPLASTGHRMAQAPRLP